MLPVRAILTKSWLAHSKVVRFDVVQCPLSNAVTASRTLITAGLSRSRPTLGEPPRLSRLPAASAKDTPRWFSSQTLTDNDVRRRVDDITEKYKEAMELLDDVRSSIGTVYFSDDMEDAENAIQDILTDYEGLLKVMTEDQKQTVLRTIGLKIEELKAQSEMLKDSIKEHR